jgi:hypothetical protein
MTLPPTRDEFYRHGPGPEVWEPLARRAAQVDVATNRLLIPSHGAAADGSDPVFLTPGPDFAADGTLPDVLSPFATYYARYVSASIIELSLTPGGVAIDFGPGEGTFGLSVEFDVGPSIDQHLAWASAKFMACASKNAWVEPLSGWGGDVKDAICKWVAWPLLSRRGYRAPPGGKDPYYEMWVWAKEQFERWCANKEQPAGVDVSPIVPPPDLNGFGSSSWAEETRGHLGKTPQEPRRRAVVS